LQNGRDNTTLLQNEEKMRMNRSVFGYTVALMSATTAVACAECYIPSPFRVCCENDLCGFYLGGNVGVLSDVAYRTDFNDFLAVGGTRSTVFTNVTIGVIAGYDWQWSHKLLGIAGDWNWININTRHTAHATIDSVRDRFDWFSTLRGRAGVTVCDALFYLTAGAAVADSDIRWTSSVTDSAFHFRRTRWGWAGGFGVEYNVWHNWSIAGELLFLNFGRDHRKGSAFIDVDIGTRTFRFAHSDTAYVGRILFNYRIGNLLGF
jgi:opacity protein-like surface antigen